MPRRWEAVFEVAPRGPRVDSITIRPTSRKASGWTVRMGRAYGSVASVQVTQDLGRASELTARMLRRLQPGRALSEALQAIRDPRIREGLEDWLGPDWARLADTALRSAGPLRDRRRATLAATAARYIAACEAGDRSPVATVAAGLGLRPQQVRDRLYKARVVGLLTPTAGRGRAGGRLTPAAIQVLKKEGSA